MYKPICNPKWTIFFLWKWQLFKFFITYAAIYGDFTEIYRIGIAYTEMEVHAIKRTRVFLGYKPLLSDWVTYVHLPHTHMGWPICVYPYGLLCIQNCSIHIWAVHTSMRQMPTMWVATIQCQYIASDVSWYSDILFNMKWSQNIVLYCFKEK